MRGSRRARVRSRPCARPSRQRLGATLEGAWRRNSTASRAFLHRDAHPAGPAHHAVRPARPRPRGAGEAAARAANSCERGLDEADRAAAFEGRMRAVSRASRMQMRFTLQARRQDTGRWNALPAARLRGVADQLGGGDLPLRLHQARRATSLAPASYRALVRFRWVDAARRARRVGEVVPRRPAASPTTAAEPAPARSASRPPTGRLLRRRYVVPVRQPRRQLRGRLSRRRDDRRHHADAAQVPVVPLEPGERRSSTVEGPPCRPGSILSADVDPRGAVDERDEARQPVQPARARAPPPWPGSSPAPPRPAEARPRTRSARCREITSTRAPGISSSKRCAPASGANGSSFAPQRQGRHAERRQLALVRRRASRSRPPVELELAVAAVARRRTP